MASTQYIVYFKFYILDGVIKVGITRRFDYNGAMISIREIAKIEGISRDSLRYRIDNGMTLEDAIYDAKKAIDGSRIIDPERLSPSALSLPVMIIKL
jgi:hypothetical protein